MHFDLTDLRLYLNILDAGNITAGAACSHLSLAAASARVRAMEASLGIDLLERGRRGVTPTPAGKALANKTWPNTPEASKAGCGCCATPAP
jgi:DNA-binding transcriptional LysR family regulator